MFYALTNGQEDAPNGCDWACAAPFRIYSGACVPCNLTNPVDPALACMHPWLWINGTGVRSSVQTGGVNYTLYVFPTSGYISFSQNTTVDVLVIGGGGAGGGAIPGQAGGGSEPPDRGPDRLLHGLGRAQEAAAEEEGFDESFERHGLIAPEGFQRPGRRLAGRRSLPAHPAWIQAAFQVGVAVDPGGRERGSAHSS